MFILVGSFLVSSMIIQQYFYQAKYACSFGYSIQAPISDKFTSAS